MNIIAAQAVGAGAAARRACTWCGTARAGFGVSAIGAGATARSDVRSLRAAAGRHRLCRAYGLRRRRRCGSAEGLDAGRHCLRKWGFRRCEDICWIKTNVSQERRSALRPDAHSVLQHTKVHPKTLVNTLRVRLGRCTCCRTPGAREKPVCRVEVHSVLQHTWVHPAALHVRLGSCTCCSSPGAGEKPVCRVEVHFVLQHTRVHPAALHVRLVDACAASRQVQLNSLCEGMRCTPCCSTPR